MTLPAWAELICHSPARLKIEPGTTTTAPWALSPPRAKVRRKAMLNFFIVRKRYFTVAPVDSMVTVPPVGTAIGATSRPNTIGLLVVRPSGIKLCPPNIPMSLREPSRSLYCGSGGPALMHGEVDFFPLSLSEGLPTILSVATTPPWT